MANPNVYFQGEPYMSQYHGRAPWGKDNRFPPEVQAKLHEAGLTPDKMLGWFRVPDQYYEKIACESCKQMICPCFWCCFPCFACNYFTIKNTLPTITTIVTRDSILTFKESIGCCGAGCSSSGKDSQDTNFRNVQSVAVNNQASGCCACCVYPSVNVTLDTLHSTGGKHPRMVNDVVMIVADQPEAPAAFIRSLMIAREERPSNVVVGHTVNTPTGFTPNFEAGGGGGAPPPGYDAGGEDIPSKIRKLQKLKEDGILTEAEFTEKKGELLARM